MKTIDFLKKILKVVLVAVVSFGISFGSVPSNLYAVETENVVVRYALDELNKNSYWDWQVVVDEYAGMPKTFYGSLTNRYEGEQIEVAQQFLSDYLYSVNIFGIENNLFDYKIVDVINSIGTYILYVQTYNNIPIEHSYLLISVTPRKSISLVKSRTFIHLDIDTNPQLGEQEAYNIAIEDAKETVGVYEPGDVALVIFPNKEKIQVAWKVQFKTDEFGGMIEYIISNSGEILEKIIKIGEPLLQDLPKSESPIFNQEDVISVLNSLESNSALKDETKKLIDIMSALEYDDYKQIVSSALITSALNVFNNPQNLPVYLEILKNKNFITEEVYNQFLAKIQGSLQQALPEKEQEIQEPQTKTLILANDAPLILIDSEPLVQILPNPDEENADALIPQTESENIPDTTTVQTPNEPAPPTTVGPGAIFGTNTEQTTGIVIPPRIPAPDAIGSDSSINNVPPDTTNPAVEPVMAKTTETVPVLTQEQIDQMQAAMEETIRNTAIVSAAQELPSVVAVENTVEPLLAALNESINTPLDTSGPKPECYVVQTSDTASAIALYYGVDTNQLGSVSSGQELYFPAAHNEPYHDDTLEEAQAQVNDGYRMLQSAQNEITSLQSQASALMANPMTMAAGAAMEVQIQVGIVKLHAAEQTYADLVRHLEAVQDQIQNQQASSNNSQGTTNSDSNNNNTETETQSTTTQTNTSTAITSGSSSSSSTIQGPDSIGSISDTGQAIPDSSDDSSSDSQSQSGQEGAAATGGITGYNTDSDDGTYIAMAEPDDSGSSSSSQGSGATGGITAYYIPPSGYSQSPASSSSTQGAGATGGITGSTQGSGATGGITGSTTTPSNATPSSPTNTQGGQITL